MKKRYDNYMTRLKAFMKQAIKENYPLVPRAMMQIVMHLLNENYWEPVTCSDFELSRLSNIKEGSIPYARQFLIDKGFISVTRKNNTCCYALLNFAQNELGDFYPPIRRLLGESGEERRNDAVSQSGESVINTCIPNTSLDDNCAAVAQSAASVVGNGTKKEYDYWVEKLPEKQRRTLQALTDKLTPKQYKTVQQKYEKYGCKKNSPYAYMLTIIRQIANGSPDAGNAHASNAQASPAQGQAVNETLAAKRAQSDARILEEARKIAAANGLQDPLTRLGNQTLTVPAAATYDTLTLSAACDLPDSINAQAVIEYVPAEPKREFTCAEAAKLEKDLPVGAVITTQPSKEEIAEAYRKVMDAKYEAQCNASDDDIESTDEQGLLAIQSAMSKAAENGLADPQVACEVISDDASDINLDESISAETVETISEDDDSAQIDADKSKAMALCATFGMNPNCVDGLAKTLRERREAAQAKPTAKSVPADLGLDENLINGYVQAAQGVTLPDEPTYDELRAMKYSKAFKVTLNYENTISDLLNLPNQTIEYRFFDNSKVHDCNLRTAIQLQQRELYDTYKAEAIFVQNVRNAVFKALGRKTSCELLELMNKPRHEVYKAQKEEAEETLENMEELEAYRAANRFIYRRNSDPNEYLVIERDVAEWHYSDGGIHNFKASYVWGELACAWFDLFTLEKVEPLNSETRD